MKQLYQDLAHKGSLRGVFVSGAGTDVGKTLVTAALLSAMRSQGLLTPQALKVIQTGVEPAQTAWAPCSDERFYNLASDDEPGLPAAGRTLFSFPLAASPHLAARVAGQRIDCGQLASAIRAHWEISQADFLIMEGAGGLLAPLNEQENLLDLVKRLFLPLILVCPNGLGALNHALLSLAALENAGLELAAIILNDSAASSYKAESRILDDNEELLRSRLKPGVGFWRLPRLPGAGPVRTRSAAIILADLAEKLAAADLSKQANIRKRDQRLLWHPYASATRPPRLEVARGSHHNRIVLEDGQELVDGMSSWWASIHGYRHPALMDALTRQAATLPHVMFGGFTHEPAVALGERLSQVLPAGLRRIFLADSGSVAVEVAMKMAMQFQQARGEGRRTLFLTPRGGYHGDTLGAMSVCDPKTGMHRLFKGLLARQVFLPRPACRFTEPFDPVSLEAASVAFDRLGEQIAAVILEPIVQGAGGMWFYHPLYLSGLAKLCRAHDCLLILDEIATGFGRTGRYFASEWARVTPDIMCVGKALTGGVMTLAATACTERVAQGICAEGGVFMHGPTFMGNPLACAVACASLDLLAKNSWQGQVKRLERSLQSGLASCAGLPGVKDVRILGSIGVVEMTEAVNMDALHRFFVDQGVWLRPFGRLIYLMPPYISPEEDIARLCSAVHKAVSTGIWRS